MSHGAFDALKKLKPKRKRSGSEWADEERHLSAKTSAVPGKWKNIAYQVEMMDACTSGQHRIVCFMTSSQIGKTDIINNIHGYFMTDDPSPIIHMQPTIKMATAYRKIRLNPMIQETPILLEKLGDPYKRSSANELLNIDFGDGYMALIGSHSAADLASRPARIATGDEIDRCETDVEGEGSATDLLFRRLQTFWNALALWVSTPTIDGVSAIQKYWNISDQRKFYVPCPHCEHEQIFVFERLKWEKGHPETARYHCESCNGTIGDRTKDKMVDKGRWIKGNPESKIAGFWINAFYSPFVTLAQIARDWDIAVSKGMAGIKTFKNTVLGEPFKLASQEFSINELLERREKYAAEVPMGAVLLTCGVDTQDDRLEVVVRGNGKDGESWRIAYYVLHGDPAHKQVWDELDAILETDFKHESGAPIRISKTCIDYQGHRSDYVLAYCKARKDVYAVRGDGKRKFAPIVPLRKDFDDDELGIINLGTDTAKDVIYACLNVKKPGPNYMHFPETDQFDKEYFLQLTAERFDIEKKLYVKVRTRNEAIDTEVYALAAYQILISKYKRINWDGLLEQLKEKAKSEKKEKETPPAGSGGKKPGGGGGFSVTSW